MPNDGGCHFASTSHDFRSASCWRPDRIPITVILDAAPDGFSAVAVDPAKLGTLLADELGPDGRHVVIADVEGEHRLWLRNTEPDKPMAVLLLLDKDFETRIDSLLRFHRRLFGKLPGPQPRGWALTSYRRDRLLLMLRALDMHLGGYSYREIASALGETDAARLPATEWKDSRARSWTIRLVTSACQMMNGGYRKLLQIR